MAGTRVRSTFPDAIVCPETEAPLQVADQAQAQSFLAAGAKSVNGPGYAAGSDPSALGLLMREHGREAYPVVDGIPILMRPEMLIQGRGGRELDALSDPRYAEAYQERDYYDRVASREIEALDESFAFSVLEPCRLSSPAEQRSFPVPISIWLDATYEPTAQFAAYRHLTPIVDSVSLQLGGTGISAVKFLLAGAREAYLLTPMLGEARFARALAERMGVSERFHCVVGVGEELPFQTGTFDVIYSGACIHHLNTEPAFHEIARALAPGGRFAAIEPWRAPLYGLGTKIFGKRDPNPFCRPMTRERLAPLQLAFDEADAQHYGALTRYPMVALLKVGLHLDLETVWKVTEADDRVAKRWPRLRRHGSCVALLGLKRADCP